MLKLKPYQEVARRFIKARKWALIADEMGLGKTIEAIASVQDVAGAKVIIVPAHLRLTWKYEILKWYPDSQVEVVSTSKHKYRQADFYVLSYSLLKHCEIIPTCVILDECHYIKNLRAKRTQDVHEFIAINKPEFVVALSGTPIKNNATEFYSILRLLSTCPSRTNGKQITEKNQYAFNIRFSYPRTQLVYTPQGALEVTKFDGIRNIERLKHYLKGKYLRRLTSKVADLPEMIDKEIIISAKKNKELQKAYEEYEEGSKDAHIMSLKASNARMKVKATVEYALDIICEHREPLVVFTDHVDPCIEISDQLGKKKLRIGTLHGKVKTSDREALVQQFQSGELDALVCTIGSASTGFTMTKARNIVFNDYSWSATDMAQAKKRIHRIGQTEKCIIHYILISEADKWIRDKIAAKERLLIQAL